MNNALDRTKTRKRAAVACTHCNSRRLKCDFSVSGAPCSRCRLLESPVECVVYQSRRGKYPRRRPGPPAPTQDQESSISSGGSNATQRFEPALQVALPAGVDIQSLQNEDMIEAWQVPLKEQDRVSTLKTQSDSLYADLLDGDESPPVEQQQQQEQQQNGTTILYLGNPLHNLSYTIHQSRQFGGHHRLHYSVIDTASVEGTPRAIATERGILDLPRKDIQDKLIKTYFSVIHPAYPFLDRVQFARLYAQDNYSTIASSSSLSIMLLHALLMVAFTHCPTSVLHEAGFPSREDAKSTHFERAKALWDSGQETNRVVNIQVLLLLQFRWANPTEQRDSTFWLNSAISLAQGCGMHRNTARSSLTENETRQWKRIWSCLSMRDAHLAAAQGRPLHILADDCDLAPLDESDFFEGEVEHINEDIFGRPQRLHHLFFLSMSKLSTIAGLISLGHRPRGATSALSKARDGLQEWVQTLEPELRYAGNPDINFWVRILHVFYNYLLILVDRQVMTMSEKRVDYPMTSLRPAKAIIHIFDELVEEEEISWCPSHLIPALFAATAVDVAMFESADRGIAAGRIAKFRLRISMVAMKELSAHWPVCGWVFRLFAKIIRDRHIVTTDPTVAGDPRSPPDLMLEGLYSHIDLDSQPSMSLFDPTIEIGEIFSQFASELPE